MENNVFSKISDLLVKSDKVGIVVGKNPSLDEMAAGLALYLSLTEIGKQVMIASPTQPIVELSNLVGIDKVKNSLEDAGGDLIVSFPYQDRQIEKVSYNLDEESHKLHIIVKAGEEGLQFEDRDVQFKRSGGTPKLIFTIGVPRLADLGMILNSENSKDSILVNIDNKQENEKFGNIMLASTDFSSVSEQVGNLILSLDLPLDQDGSQNLLAGISFATDNFQNPQTSFLAFEMAAALMRKGARRQNRNQASIRNNMPRPQIQNSRTQQVPQPDLQSRLTQELRALQQQRIDKKQNFPINQSVATQTSTDINITSDRNISTQQDQQTGSSQQEPPSDWLEPKVYKGSTPL